MEHPPASDPRPDDGRDDPFDQLAGHAFKKVEVDTTWSEGSVLTLLQKIPGVDPAVLLQDPETDAAPVVVPDAHKSPQGLGHYQIFGEIARGGMGVVMKGRDNDLGREVAIKVMLDQHRGNPAMLNRFVEEAQIGGQLQHPGIVPVHELGLRADHSPYFTMKLVKGKTLAALLSDRKDPAEDRHRFFSIFGKVLEAMAYAHARGVIHRDLKPSNIMVGSYGEVQVMDWGLAKVLSAGGVADEKKARQSQVVSTQIATVRTGSTGTHSQAGTVMGTPAYMPPEQARGAVEELDERADVFSLGGVLLEILTGKPPYAAESSDVIREMAAQARLEDAFIRLERSQADPELVEIVRKCLAAAAKDRLRDAGAVVKLFSSYLAAVEERRRKAEIEAAEATVRAAEERRARRLTFTLSALILTVLVAGGAGYLWMEKARQDRVDRATRSVTLAMEEATRLFAEAKVAPTSEPARWTAALAAAKRARALAVQGEVDSDTLTRVARLNEQIAADEAEAIEAEERSERDRRFFQKLEAIRLRAADRWATGGDYERLSDEAYAATFREYGIDVESLPTEEAGRRIRKAAIADQLVAALDDWIVKRLRRTHKGIDLDVRVLVAVARAVDPDPWRTRLRYAILNQDVAALRVFVRSPKVRELSAVSLTLLMGTLTSGGDTDGAIDDFLRPAARRYRSDFWINYSLGNLCMNSRPRRAREAVRYFMVASALRGQSPVARSQLAIALYRCGDFDAAISTARETLGLDPNFLRAYTTIAMALEQEGKLEEATETYEAAVRTAPEKALGHGDFGLFLSRHGKRDKAIRELKKAIECDPKDATWHYSLGIALNAKGELDGAVRAYEEAIRLKPRYGEAHNNLAGIWASRGDREKAILGYRRAVEADPELWNAVFNLGFNLKKARRFDEAISALRTAARVDPSNADTYRLLGDIHLIKREFEEALDVFRTGLRIAPTDAVLLDGVAKALNSLGRPKEAIEAIDKAVKANPKRSRAHYDRGIILTNLREYESAVAAFREAIRLKPDDFRTLCALANAYLKCGKLDESIKTAKRATVVRPQHSQAWANLALISKKNGDVRGSVAALRKAIELDPNNDSARYNLGVSLIDMGEYREAANAFREVVRRKPGVAHYQSSLGWALRQCGAGDQAVAALREAIRLRPKFAEAHYYLGAMFFADGDDASALRHLTSAVRVVPGDTTYLYQLGLLLVSRGRLAEGLKVFNRGRQLAAPGGKRAQYFDDWIERAKRMVELEVGLDAILSGERELETVEDHIAMAGVLYGLKRYAEAARFWKLTFELEESAAIDCYNAACSAASAASGGSAEECSRWRLQAVQWLRAELEKEEESFREGHLAAAYETLRTLSIWKHNRAFAVIRDEEKRAALPADEREACESLWADVDALLAKAKKRTLGTGK